MSGFTGRQADASLLDINLAMLRQIEEAESRGLSLDTFLVDEDNFLIVDESGNFLLGE